MEDKKLTIISKDTLIPIGLVLSLMGGVWFASDLNSRVKAQNDRLNTVEITISDVSEMKENVAAMKSDISWIKSALNNADIIK